MHLPMHTPRLWFGRQLRGTSWLGLSLFQTRPAMCADRRPPPLHEQPFIVALVGDGGGGAFRSTSAAATLAALAYPGLATAPPPLPVGCSPRKKIFHVVSRFPPPGMGSVTTCNWTIATLSLQCRTLCVPCMGWGGHWVKIRVLKHLWGPAQWRKAHVGLAMPPPQKKAPTLLLFSPLVARLHVARLPKVSGIHHVFVVVGLRGCWKWDLSDRHRLSLLLPTGHCLLAPPRG